MTIPIWEYNGKFYLKINAVNVKEAQVENGFKQIYIYIYIYIYLKPCSIYYYTISIYYVLFKISLSLSIYI